MGIVSAVAAFPLKGRVFTLTPIYVFVTLEAKRASGRALPCTDHNGSGSRRSSKRGRGAKDGTCRDGHGTAA